jgi:hypothetical protein
MWPLQNYKDSIAKANGKYPADVASAAWMKRELVQSVLAGDIPVSFLHENDTEDSHGVDCPPEDVWIESVTGAVICAREEFERPASTTTATMAGPTFPATTTASPRSVASDVGSMPTRMPSSHRRRAHHHGW